MLQGVDLSAMQGPNVPFADMKAKGICFAFLRCHVGNNKARDALFTLYARLASAAGIVTAPYFFPFPLPHLDPIEQVNLFVGSADLGYGVVLGTRDGDMPPAYDLEWPPPEEWAQRGCTADSIVDFALAQLAELTKRFNKLTIVYSYPWFLKALSSAKNFSKLMAYPLWIAGGAGYLSRTTAPADPEKPPIVPGWGSAWLFWQWNGNGGAVLPNGVDADFDAFNGDAAALAALCSGTYVESEAIPPTEPAPDGSEAVMHALASDLIVEDELHAYRQDRAQQMIDAAA